MADEQLSEGSAGYDLTAAGDVVWPLADQQGTIRDLAVYAAATDTTSIATHIVYDAYGNVTSITHLNSTAVDCLCCCGYVQHAIQNRFGELPEYHSSFMTSRRYLFQRALGL